MIGAPAPTSTTTTDKTLVVVVVTGCGPSSSRKPGRASKVGETPGTGDWHKRGYEITRCLLVGRSWGLNNVQRLYPRNNFIRPLFQMKNGGPEVSIWDKSRWSPFGRILAASNHLGYNVQFLLFTGTYIIEKWQILLVSPSPGNVVGDQVRQACSRGDFALYCLPCDCLRVFSLPQSL